MYFPKAVCFFSVLRQGINLLSVSLYLIRSGSLSTFGNTWDTPDK